MMITLQNKKKSTHIQLQNQFVFCEVTELLLWSMLSNLTFLMWIKCPWKNYIKLN